MAIHICGAWIFSRYDFMAQAPAAMLLKNTVKMAAYP